MPIELTPDQTTTLTANAAKARELQAELDKARRAGLDQLAPETFAQIEAALAMANSVREGLLREYSPPPAVRSGRKAR